MVIFIFIQVLIENYASKHSGDPDQTPYSVVSDLALHCLPMSHKKRARHIWVKNVIILLLIRVPEIWEVDC